MRLCWSQPLVHGCDQHSRLVADGEQLAEQISVAAENRAAAGLLAVQSVREEHDEAVVAAAEVDLAQWGAVFARAVTETARHRTATIATHRRLLDAAIERVGDDPAAVAVLTQFRSSPAVSAPWLRERIAHDPAPALARLLDSGILATHPRLPGPLVHPQLLAVLDAPFDASHSGLGWYSSETSPFALVKSLVAGSLAGLVVGDPGGAGLPGQIAGAGGGGGAVGAGVVEGQGERSRRTATGGAEAPARSPARCRAARPSDPVGPRCPRSGCRHSRPGPDSSKAQPAASGGRTRPAPADVARHRARP